MKTPQIKDETYWRNKREQVLADFDRMAMECATARQCSLYEAVCYCATKVKANHLKMAVELSQPRKDGILEPHKPDHIGNLKVYLKNVYNMDVSEQDIAQAYEEYRKGEKLIEAVN